MTTEYRDATVADVMSVIARLRPEDAIEVAASTGLTSDAAVLEAYRNSTNTKVCVIDDVPQSIFGCEPASDDIGIPWMVGTVEFPAVAKRQLLVDARKYVDEWQLVYPLLVNKVHVDNTHSIAWLTRLGFKFLDPQPLGHSGQLFLPFYRQRNV